METFKAILEMLNSFFADIVPVGDILWTFPQNFDWYANIPIIGNIPFAIWLLVGMGAFFSLKTRFVQFRYFKQGIKVLTRKKR
ncbi:MAG TPA: sodium:alanine symporter, partial [Candidatus Dorea intestinavium]|nr:sodium:alanine symporter [Candidatus Dorea intestinavium]